MFNKDEYTNNVVKEVEPIFNNKGYKSRFIQLTKPNTHISLYKVDVKLIKGTQKVSEVLPQIEYSYHTYGNYNLDNFIEEMFAKSSLNSTEYFVMEKENENNEIVSFLGILHCFYNVESNLDYGNISYYFFEVSDLRYRAIATVGFEKDFIHSLLSKNS